jgi:hypothetical protein
MLENEGPVVFEYIWSLSEIHDNECGDWIDDKRRLGLAKRINKYLQDSSCMPDDTTRNKFVDAFVTEMTANANKAMLQHSSKNGVALTIWYGKQPKGRPFVYYALYDKWNNPDNFKNRIREVTWEIAKDV